MNATGDTAFNFESIVGSTFRDTLTGNAGIDVLTGGGNGTVVAFADIVTDAESGEIDDAFSVDLFAILGAL